MPLEEEIAKSDERLSKEELDQLRARLTNQDGGLPDRRDYGAMTLSDVAETFDLPPADVEQALRQIRQERALNPEKKRIDQRALLGLALFLFASAYGIYRITPRRLSPEDQEALNERMLAEAKARQKSRPKRIHYPIKTVVTDGIDIPIGFQVMVKGELTETTSVATATKPVDRLTAEKSLTQAIVRVFEAGRTAELNAPQPPTPLPKTGFSFSPGSLNLQISTNGGGGSYTSMSMDPQLPANMTRQESVEFQAGNIAKSVVDGIVTNQNRSLQILPPSDRDAVVTAPVGFSVGIEGPFSTNISGPKLLIVPIDTSTVAAKLKQVLRSLRLREEGFDDGNFSYYSTAAQTKKTGIPAFAKVTIQGPLKDIVFQLPLNISPQYPNAVSAVRAAEKLIDQYAEEAAKQAGLPEVKKDRTKP